MARSKYGYPAEKLAVAKGCLQSSRTPDESRRYAGAFWECQFALEKVESDDLSPKAREWVATIRRISDTDNVVDTGHGLHYAKAQSLTSDERLEFFEAIDRLASFFHQKDEGSHELA
jgi:hypothetical protein